MEHPRPPRRLIAPLAAACVIALAGARPAQAESPATTSVWGYSGLALMPTGYVLGFRDFQVTGGVLTLGSSLHPVIAAEAGVFEGLEFGVVYGIPLDNFTGLSGNLKYQLIRPTKDRPTAVAVGLSLVGVNGTNRYVDGNNLYLVLSQDFNTTINGAAYTLFSGHFGFEGDLNLGSRIMAGLEIPITDRGSLFADFMGPMSANSGFFNVGAAYRPTKEIQVRAYTLGAPNVDWTNRDYCVEVSFGGNILGNLAEVADHPGPAATSTPQYWPTPRPTHHTPAPPLPTPAPSPRPSASYGVENVPETSPSPALTPEAGQATLTGTLLDDKGHPLTGWSVGAPDAGWATTDLAGRYAIELALGPHALTVKDPQGAIAMTKPIRIVAPKVIELPLVVSQPQGQLKGIVVDRLTKQGLNDANIQLFREGETYNFSSRDTGQFYFAELPAGAYRMVVTRPRYQPYEVALTLQAKQTRNLLVSLVPKSGSLAGRVAALNGQGEPGVSVSIPKLKQTAVTDRQGNYEFHDLPPGQHEVVYRLGSKPVSTTIVQIRSDETATENVTVDESPQAASKGGTIAGQITDQATHRPIAGVKIVVEGGDLTVLTITAADGHFTVSDLPPGRYKLTATKAGYKSKLGSASVTQKAGATVNLALQLGH